MMRLALGGPVERVLCLGAHPDDIEIGALGTVSRLADRNPDASFTFVILTGNDDRHTEAEASVKELLDDRATLHLATFQDGFLPYERPADVKRWVRSAIGDTNCQLVLSPRSEDLHQDHAFVARLAHQLLRDHLILEYEIAKYDGDLTPPQVFVPLTDEEVAAKVDHLMRHFASQHNKPWYDEGGFRSLMRIRGIESSSPSGYAEAFHVSKMWLA